MVVIESYPFTDTKRVSWDPTDLRERVFQKRKQRKAHLLIQLFGLLNNYYSRKVSMLANGRNPLSCFFFKITVYKAALNIQGELRSITETDSWIGQSCFKEPSWLFFFFLTAKKGMDRMCHCQRDVVIVTAQRWFVNMVIKNQISSICCLLHSFPVWYNIWKAATQKQ